MSDTFSRIWNFAEKQQKTLLKALLFAFLRCSFAVTQLFAIVLALRTVSGELPAKESLIRIVVLTVVCIVGTFCTNYIEQISSMQAGFYMTADKRVSIGSLLRRVPLGFFTESSTGRITATLTSTLTGVEMAASMTMTGIISGLFNGVAMLIFMLFYDWRIGILTAVGMVVYLFVVSRQMKLSRRDAPARQKAQTELAEAALSFLQGIRVTKAFSLLQGNQRLKEAIAGSRAENIRLTDKSMPSQLAAYLTIAVFEALVLLAAVALHFGENGIDSVKAILLVIFSFMVFAPLNQAGSMLSMIGMLETGMDEAEEIEQTKQLTCKEPVCHPVSDEIVFKDVSFSYGEEEVLHHINTVIKPHSLTAVIGPSGSGKTTLCQLILRFRDISSGSITLGGADLRHIPSEELMKKISTVFQRVYLFEDTILNNIRFGRPDVTLEEVREAAKAARCDDFIMALPDGYDTLVKESGSSLSGGEKQRISIARAMLKDAPIIILDEATSALDAENEQDILAAIDRLTENKTVIMIAHRIQSVQKADHIIALEKGSVVQEGTHETLKTQKGLYADFLASREKAGGWQLTH